MNPYAELSDLEDRFPRALTSDEETRAETLLVDASFWLGVWVPGLSTTSDETVLEAAKLVVVEMVKRTLLDAAANVTPAVDSITEGAGIFSRSVRYRRADYAREIEDLEGLLRGSRASAVSMRSPGL